MKLGTITGGATHGAESPGNPGSAENQRTGRSILIVDDEPQIRATLRKVLENMGWNDITEAGDGDDAVVISGETQPDVILMDQYMARVNGLEATRKIRNSNPLVKIVIMTGMPKPSLVADCMKAGATTFMIKPFRIQQLLNVVGKTPCH